MLHTDVFLHDLASFLQFIFSTSLWWNCQQLTGVVAGQEGWEPPAERINKHFPLHIMEILK